MTCTICHPRSVPASENVFWYVRALLQLQSIGCKCERANRRLETRLSLLFSVIFPISSNLAGVCWTSFGHISSFVLPFAITIEWDPRCRLIQIPRAAPCNPHLGPDTRWPSSIDALLIIHGMCRGKRRMPLLGSHILRSYFHLDLDIPPSHTPFPRGMTIYAEDIDNPLPGLQ
ncbi:hypothetical protein BD779DRAFT_282933 [Infundibulicybe gibba]|nr:hypothetical protein BD779DRAFT_282933 [Infundibulicybe gibba]